MEELELEAAMMLLLLIKTIFIHKHVLINFIAG